MESNRHVSNIWPSSWVVGGVVFLTATCVSEAAHAALLKPIQSSLELRFAATGNGFTATDGTSDQQLDSFFPLGASAFAVATTPVGSVSYTVSAEATFSERGETGRFTLNNFGYEVDAGIAEWSVEGIISYRYTFISDIDGTFILDRDITADPTNTDDSDDGLIPGGLSPSFRWTTGTSSLSVGDGRFGRIRYFRDLEAGETYTFEVFNNASISSTLSRSSSRVALVDANYSWEVFPEPVPESIPIFGAMTILGVGAALKKTYSRNLEKAKAKIG